MPDILRTDGRISRTLPNAYSELMLPVCGGHALWFPRKVDLGGGALGDIGCIDDGAFEKTFNVYESLPGDLPLLQRPTTGVTLDEHFNMPSMRSSRRSTIDLHISGSSSVASLPLSVSPATIEPRINLQEEKFAFLIPPQPVQMDHLSLDRRDELRNWLTVHRRMLREGSIIITKVVRSSGWLGGVATGRKVETGAALTADAPSLGRVEFGASRTYEATMLADIKGPSNWTSNANAEYVLVVGFLMARGRFGQLRDRFRLAMPSSSTSHARTMPPAQPGDLPTPSRPSRESQPRASGSGDVKTEPLVDIEVLSESDALEETDSILLTSILDHILITHEDIDVAVADSSVIADFIDAYGVLPSPPEIEPVMTTRSVHVKDVGRTLVESVGFVDRLRPVGIAQHPVDSLFQPLTRTLSDSHPEQDRLPPPARDQILELSPEDDLTDVERAYLFAQSQLVSHRVHIARHLPALLEDTTPVDAVTYIMPLLGPLAQDTEAVQEVLVAGLADIMRWFFTHCALVQGDVPEDVRDPPVMISVQSFTPLLGNLLMHPHTLVGASAQMVVVKTLDRIRSADMGVTATDLLFGAVERGLVERELVFEVVVGLAHLDNEDDSDNNLPRVLQPSDGVALPLHIAPPTESAMPTLQLVESLRGSSSGDALPAAIAALYRVVDHCAQNGDLTSEEHSVDLSQGPLSGDASSMDAAGICRLASMSLIATIANNAIMPLSHETQIAFVEEVLRQCEDPNFVVRREAAFAFSALCKVVSQRNFSKQMLPLFER
ncbi:hypothetical protein EXIGLDRAFT_737193 [Exidia glandulosa HHB12029]|uniref:Uncharacterized protein n=1 Tax=Exidia glandulosa HHB12029 TaxID=1314781 RepID=A0A165J4A6_EXIGL|nr:hypothetical protein EXIGLDRAFT_737193 [Exidia glandulosa HHB12029]